MVASNTPYDAPTGIMPAMDAFAIIPSNSVDLQIIARALWIGGTGDVTLDTPGGTTVTISAVPAGYLLPIMAKRVRSSLTTATLIVGLV